MKVRGFRVFQSRYILITGIFCSFSLQAFAQTYLVSYKNNTTQTLTSAVCALHDQGLELFVTGSPASAGLEALAEDGDSSDFVDELKSSSGVHKVSLGDFLKPKSKDSLSIKSRRGKFISCVFGMLVTTNDAFPAFIGKKLPSLIGKKSRFTARVYDAGTEVNTESCHDVPGAPCNAHFVGPAENGVISLHAGIVGGADLSVQDHGWKEPGVRGTITRIK